MRKQIALVLVPLGLAGVALPAAASEPAAHAAATKKVKVGDLFFKKSKITVESGDTVKWTWVGGAPHDVTVTSGAAQVPLPARRRPAPTRRSCASGAPTATSAPCTRPR